MASEHPKVPAEIESGIQNFDHGKLKHAETAEKNPLPSSESECTYLTASQSIAAYFYTRSNVVCLSVSVCLLVIFVNRAKTAEPI